MVVIDVKRIVQHELQMKWYVAVLLTLGAFRQKPFCLSASICIE